MYSKRSGLILGFHGCDKTTVENVVYRNKKLIKSNNDFDWLGHGIYFWENSPSRAFEYATYLKKHPIRNKSTEINEPAVLGAVLDLGFCLDLIEMGNLKLLKEAYDFFIETYKKSGYSIPQNKNVGENKDLLLRNLDCAVIETLHKIRQDSKIESFDSVKAVFLEGEDLYKNAGFKEKNHIQICIRNPNCIKGLFVPREIDTSYKST